MFGHLRFPYLLPSLLTVTCHAVEPEPVCSAADVCRPSPNILLILADDQGFGDVGFNGNQVLSTPNLDALATEGIRFNSFYVSPACAPTRASLLTGRYHQRTGVVGVIEGREFMVGDETTVAESLSAAGYVTGLIGKWHLGENYPWVPQGQGFGEFTGFRDGSAPYFDVPLETSGVVHPTTGYLTDVLTDAAISFLERHRKDPFFLYLAYNAPHNPLQVPDRYIEPYRHLTERTALVYGMMASLDENVGRLLRRLDKLGLRENTLVIFMSDNGPLFTGAGAPAAIRFNGGLRGAKYDVLEGGIRVPFVARWPGRIPPGQVTDTPAAHIDVMPTLLDMAGVAAPAGVTLDGVSLRPVLEGDPGRTGDRTLFMSYAHERRANYDPPRPYPGGMARQGRFKMVDGDQLYDLGADPGEARNLAQDFPDLLAGLDKSYREFWRDVTSGRQPYPRVPFGYMEENPVQISPHWSLLEGGAQFVFGPAEAPTPRVVGVHGDRIGGWTSSARAIWRLQAHAAGRYQVSIRARALTAFDPVEVRLQLGDAMLVGKVPAEVAPDHEWLDIPFGVAVVPAAGAVDIVVTTPVGDASLEIAGVALTRVNPSD